MLDLITQIQLKDGVEAYERVAARVEEVGRIVGTITRDLDGWNGKARYWRLDGFTIEMRDETRNDMQHLIDHQVQVRFRTAWEERPPTEKYGDPRDDEWSEYSRESDIVRTIRFPRRYLLTNGWEDEVAEKAAANQRWWAGHHADQLEQRIKTAEAELIKLKESYVQLRQKSLT